MTAAFLTRTWLNITLSSLTIRAPSKMDKFIRISYLSAIILVIKMCCFRSGFASGTHDHMFTSYANLLKLYYMEGESLSNVDVFLREELLEHGDQHSADAAHNLTSVRKLVQLTKHTHRQVGSKVREYLSHPINVFHLTQRLRTGWKTTIDVIRNSKACREWHMPQVMSRLSNIESNLPTEEDLASVAYNLVTIQHTQGIPTSSLLQGIVGHHPSLSPVSPQEQFLVAKRAVEEDDYYYAAQWLKHLSKSPKLKEMSRVKDGFNATNVLGMLASAYFRINMVSDALKATDELLKKDPENVVARSNKAFFEDRVAKKSKNAKSGRPVRYGKDDMYRRNYETLCRGKKIKPSRLKCRLEPVWPGSKLAFHKMEVLQLKPPVIAFHGVISRHDAAKIVNISNAEYEGAATESVDGFRTPYFTLVLSKAGKYRRMSMTTRAEYLKLLDKIRRRVETLPQTTTGPFASGESEARNFGLQGFYFKPSPDFEIQNLGAHTGTTLLFLNDVEMGGEVVFPSVRTRVEPEVGKVVFYFPSFKKFHAICPVAYGTEWVLVHSMFEKRAPNWCRPHEDPDFVSSIDKE